MKCLSFKIPLGCLVQCVVLSQLLGVVDSSTTAPVTPAATTPSPTTRKPPADVGHVEVVDQKETNITLQWDKVGTGLTYRLSFNGRDIEIPVNNEGSEVVYVVFDLTPGTRYTFTLFTVDGELQSTGHTFTTRTAPKNVNDVTVVKQTESTITLQWNKVDNILDYILDSNGIGIDRSENVSTETNNQLATFVVSGLTAGEKYSFTLFTVFENVKSSGYTFTAVTAPENVILLSVAKRTESSITLEWLKFGDILDYILEYNGNGIDKSENVSAEANNQLVTFVVSNLTAATNYSFTLFTVFENVKSSGYTITAITAPKNVVILNVENQTESSITLQWNKVGDILDYILEYNGNGINKSENVSAEANNELATFVVSNLTAGKKYSFTLFTVFENVKSSGYTFTAVTAPRNVDGVTAVDQTETNISLVWNKVGDSFIYTLVYDGSDPITVEDGNESVKYTVLLPDAGRRYSFTHFTVFEGVSSTGYRFNASTVPPMVDGVTVTDRTLTSITLQWKNANPDWRYQLDVNDRTQMFEPSNSPTVSYEVTSLKPGTKHSFSLTTLFEHKSRPFESFTLTVIDCSSINWQVTSTSIQATVEGEFTVATIKDKTGSPISTNNNVLFTGLCPGETYQIMLEYKTATERLTQSECTRTVSPSDPVGRCQYAASGYSVRVVWDEPVGVCTGAEVNVSGKVVNVAECESHHVVIPGFQPARSYQVSLGLLSGNERSLKPFIFDCYTDPRGVIAGAVIAVLILLILICVAFFIYRRRSNVVRRKKSSIGSKPPPTTIKPIPIEKFQNHFFKLNSDDKRAFTLEYDDLSPVGTDQTQRAATLPQNKERNRYTNILPYDWSRVKLMSPDFAGTSDYINANYMPGYKRDKEYIAAQGPLPTTLSDFWRMIWEQEVNGIVMVTNCTENGRIKCEQYWPDDGQSRIFGALSVTTSSEQKEQHWTLRDFTVKHKNNSEKRRVKHFHFTAWPDHGVPQSTDVLIEFRGLVRHHMEREGGRAPTVVHCSAGVGRTGTIIALDVLLQQLEKEQAVGIYGFVHTMRQHRAYMVQTEPQYVFLHQCIMDTLHQKELDEHIYQNADDLFYVNATALKQFHQQN